MADDPTPQDPALEPKGNEPAPEPKEPAKGDEGDKTFTQADLDRILAGRLAKFADYDEIKRQRDELTEANATEQEKAAKAAKDEGRAEARSEYAPLLVAAKFETAAKGRMEPAALASLLEDLDLAKFVTAEGAVDADRIEAKINALTPEPAPSKPSLGGGARKTEKPQAGSLGEAIQQRLASTTPR